MAGPSVGDRSVISLDQRDISFIKSLRGDGLAYLEPGLHWVTLVTPDDHVAAEAPYADRVIFRKHGEEVARGSMVVVFVAKTGADGSLTSAPIPAAVAAQIEAAPPERLV